MTIFSPNGITTYEKCPVCRQPDIKVEHGKGVHDYPWHFEHCPGCGDSMVLVCFDCPDCKEENTNEQDKHRMD